MENSAGHVQRWVVLDANYLDYRLGNYSRSVGSWRAVEGVGGVPCFYFMYVFFFCEFILKLSTEGRCACVGELHRAALLGA